jgi:soluble lytic murein transglycosylase-like protein
LADRMRTIEPHIHEAARKFGLDVSLIKAVIAAESAVRADALSNKNAKGLMQLIDSTAADMGVQNVWDPRENIMGGSRYLKMMLDRHQGDVTLALASYNAGPGAVDRFSGVPPYRETQTYIERVLNYREYFTAEE